MLTFGLRYEHVSFRFDDLHETSRSLSCSSDELFPSVSFATQLGLVQLSLGYGIKTIPPAFGRFTTTNTLGMQKQWLTFNLSDPRTPSGWREVSYNKPMLIFNSNNTLRLSHGWQLELNSEFYNKSHFRNARIYENFWNLTAAVQKTFLKSDALVVRLSCSDIFDTAHHSVGLDLGNYYLYETNVCGGQRTLYTFRHLNLTVRNAFNSTKSKYKGKGAGQDIIKRI